MKARRKAPTGFPARAPQPAVQSRFHVDLVRAAIYVAGVQKNTASLSEHLGFAVSRELLQAALASTRLRHELASSRRQFETSPRRDDKPFGLEEIW